MFFQILLLAVLVEAVVEGIKWVYAQPDKMELINRLIALVVGIGTCVLIPQADIFALAEFNITVPYVGQVLTGIIIARGANFVHDLISGVKQIRENLETKG